MKHYHPEKSENPLEDDVLIFFTGRCSSCPSSPNEGMIAVVVVVVGGRVIPVPAVVDAAFKYLPIDGMDVTLLLLLPLFASNSPSMVPSTMTSVIANEPLLLLLLLLLEGRPLRSLLTFSACSRFCVLEAISAINNASAYKMNKKIDRVRVLMVQLQIGAFYLPASGIGFVNTTTFNN